MQHPDTPSGREPERATGGTSADDQERWLDDALESTFPASDPVAAETPER
jgi:hypothetical protein